MPRGWRARTPDAGVSRVSYREIVDKSGRSMESHSHSGNVGLNRSLGAPAEMVFLRDQCVDDAGAVRMFFHGHTASL